MENNKSFIPSNETIYNELTDSLQKLIDKITEQCNTTFIHISPELQQAYKDILAGYSTNLKDSIELINREKVQITFSGYFSSGKTSLINKLLGDNVFRVSPPEESGVACYISKGDTDQFFVYYKDKQYPKQVTLEDLKKLTSMAISDGAFESIEKSEAHLNNPIIPEKITWVDTAGLTSKNNDDKKDRLISAIKETDILVWISKSGSSGGFLTDEEKEILTSIPTSPLNSPLFFINNVTIPINKWESWNEDTVDEIRNAIKKEERYYLHDSTIEKQWHTHFTDDVVNNKLKIVNELFKDYTPIIPTKAELEKIYENPLDEKSQFFIQIINERRPLLLKFYSFSTLNKVKRIDNEIQFDHFRKNINTINNRFDDLVFFSRLEKVKYKAAIVATDLEKLNISWTDSVITKYKDDLQIKKAEVTGLINTLIVEKYDKAIETLKTNRQNALSRFDAEHNYLIKWFDSDYNRLSDGKTSPQNWNNFVSGLKEKYLYFDNNIYNPNYKYEDWVSVTYNPNGKTQTEENIRAEKGVYDGKGYQLTKQLFLDYDNVMEELEKILLNTYEIIGDNYFPHTFSNIDWFKENCLAPIKNFVLNKKFKQKFFNSVFDREVEEPFRRIFLGYVTFYEFFAANIFSSEKISTVIDIKKSIDRTKELIAQAYNDRIKYLEDLKKMKIEEDKSEFLGLFEAEYLREFNEVQNFIRSTYAEVLGVFAALQLHSIIRP